MTPQSPGTPCNTTAVLVSPVHGLASFSSGLTNQTSYPVCWGCAGVPVLPESFIHTWPSPQSVLPPMVQLMHAQFSHNQASSMCTSALCCAEADRLACAPSSRSQWPCKSSRMPHLHGVGLACAGDPVGHHDAAEAAVHEAAHHGRRRGAVEVLLAGVRPEHAREGEAREAVVLLPVPAPVPARRPSVGASRAKFAVSRRMWVEPERSHACSARTPCFAHWHDANPVTLHIACTVLHERYVSTSGKVLHEAQCDWDIWLCRPCMTGDIRGSGSTGVHDCLQL